MTHLPIKGVFYSLKGNLVAIYDNRQHTFSILNVTFVTK